MKKHVWLLAIVFLFSLTGWSHAAVLKKKPKGCISIRIKNYTNKSVLVSARVFKKKDKVKALALKAGNFVSQARPRKKEFSHRAGKVCHSRFKKKTSYRMSIRAKVSGGKVGTVKKNWYTVNFKKIGFTTYTCSIRPPKKLKIRLRLTCKKGIQRSKN